MTMGCQMSITSTNSFNASAIRLSDLCNYYYLFKEDFSSVLSAYEIQFNEICYLRNLQNPISYHNELDAKHSIHIN